MKIVEDLYGDSLGAGRQRRGTRRGHVARERPEDRRRAEVEPMRYARSRRRRRRARRRRGRDGRGRSIILRTLTVAYGRRWCCEGVETPASTGARSSASSARMAAGKSTLLKAILGIVPIVARDRYAVRAAVLGACGRAWPTFPSARSVDWDFPVTVWDVVMMGRYPHDRVAPSARAPRIRALVDRRAPQVGHVGAPPHPDRPALRRASSSACSWRARSPRRPTSCLLDEPFNGIDATRPRR